MLRLYILDGDTDLNNEIVKFVINYMLIYEHIEIMINIFVENHKISLNIWTPVNINLC